MFEAGMVLLTMTVTAMTTAVQATQNLLDVCGNLIVPFHQCECERIQARGRVWISLMESEGSRVVLVIRNRSTLILAG